MTNVSQLDKSFQTVESSKLINLVKFIFLTCDSPCGFTVLRAVWKWMILSLVFELKERTHQLIYWIIKGIKIIIPQHARSFYSYIDDSLSLVKLFRQYSKHHYRIHHYGKIEVRSSQDRTKVNLTLVKGAYTGLLTEFRKSNSIKFSVVPYLDSPLDFSAEATSDTLSILNKEKGFMEGFDFNKPIESFIGREEELYEQIFIADNPKNILTSIDLLVLLNTKEANSLLERLFFFSNLEQKNQGFQK